MCESVIILKELPEHVAEQCLARLPARARAAASCVSRAWRSALCPAAILPLRRNLHISSDELLFLAAAIKQQTTRWNTLLLHPGRHKISLIPGPVIDYEAAVCIAGKLYLLAAEKKSLIILSYKNGIWNSIPGAATVLRRSFACAVLGRFVYVAGGFGVSGESLSSAARFDTDRMAWEALPDMTTERDTCSGFVLDRKFYVIGGFKACPPAVDDVEEYSAEVYDPWTGTWTLVEGMWAESLRWRAGPEDRRRPVVAVVGNTLYGLEQCTSHLFRYDTGSGRWEYLDCFGQQCGNMQLVGGEDDLYGVCGCVCSSQGKLSVFAFTHGEERFDWRKIELYDVALKGCEGVMFGCCGLA